MDPGYISHRLNTRNNNGSCLPQALQRTEIESLRDSDLFVSIAIKSCLAQCGVGLAWLSVAWRYLGMPRGAYHCLELPRHSFHYKIVYIAPRRYRTFFHATCTTQVLYSVDALGQITKRRKGFWSLQVGPSDTHHVFTSVLRKRFFSSALVGQL
jgi:hypothetical protein